MFKNRLKARLQQGDTVLGTFISVNSPDIIEIVGLSGFDFVVIDTEHGPFSVETTTNLIRSAELHGITPLTRVTEGSETTILRALDVGTHGIQVPQVNNGAAAQAIVQAAKYFPIGNRGIAMPRASDYGMINPMEYFKKANEETLIIAHCETKMSLNNLEDIAKIPDIDVIFLGPFDMSQSLGIPGQVHHPLIQEAAERVLSLTRQYGKVAGIFAIDGEQARKRAEQGFRYITLGIDLTLFAKACRSEVAAFKG